MDRRRANMKRIYEDDNWIIDIQDTTLLISAFKDNHWQEDLMLALDIFLHGNEIEEIKNILYKRRFNNE